MTPYPYVFGKYRVVNDQREVLRTGDVQRISAQRFKFDPPPTLVMGEYLEFTTDSNEQM